MILNKEELNIAKGLSIAFCRAAGFLSDIGTPFFRKNGNYDFADYRHFMPGDDIRNIDWHHYADKRMLVLKEHEGIESPDYCIYIDLSDSVVCGGVNKVRIVKKMAAVLVYLLLKYNLKVKILNSDNYVKSSSLTVQHAEYLFNKIEKLEPGGDTGAGKIYDSLSMLNPGERLVFISDLVCPDGPEYLLKAIASRCPQAAIFNVFMASESKPELNGSYTLADAESGKKLPVFIDDGIRSEYIKIYRHYYETIRHGSAKKNWPYYDINADMSIVDNLHQVTNNGMLLL